MALDDKKWKKEVFDKIDDIHDELSKLDGIASLIHREIITGYQSAIRYPCYKDWSWERTEDKHSSILAKAFVSQVEVHSKLNKIKDLKLTAVGKKEAIKLLDSFNVVRVNKYTRFPGDDAYIDIYSEKFYKSIISIREAIEETNINDLLKALEELIVLLDPENCKWSNAEFKDSLYNVLTFEKRYALHWQDL